MDKLPLHLTGASGVPYYRQIVDQIAQLIRSGQLAPNALLPSVRDLAAQTLVSLITVRRAYADLENAGLIVRRQGYGTYVAEEVQAASREQAEEDAREALGGAITRSRHLGLRDEEIRAVVDGLLAPEGGKDGIQ